MNILKFCFSLDVGINLKYPKSGVGKMVPQGKVLAVKPDDSHALSPDMFHMCIQAFVSTHSHTQITLTNGIKRLCMVLFMFNPSTQEAEAGRAL